MALRIKCGFGRRWAMAGIVTAACGASASAQVLPLTLAINDALPQSGGSVAGGTGAATPDAPPSPPPSGDQWSVTIAPYLWAPSVSGTVTVGARSASFDASFIDVLQESDSVLGFMGALEVNYGNWIMYVDGIWMDTRAKKQTSTVGVLDVSVQIAIAEFGLGYRVLELPAEGTGSGVTGALDALVGGRYSSLDVSLYQATVFSASRDQSFVSPVIGGRFTLNFGKDWRIITSGSVGGFDVGSQFEWSALVALEWRFQLGSVDAGVILGYKALGYQLQNGPKSLAETDLVLYGPVLGMTFTF